MAKKKASTAERRVPISIYVPVRMFKDIDEQAQGESRSKSQMVLVLISEALKARRELQLA